MERIIKTVVILILCCTGGLFLSASKEDVITVKEGKDIVFKVAENLPDSVWEKRTEIRVFKEKKELINKEGEVLWEIDNGCIVRRNAAPKSAGDYTIKVESGGKIYEYKAKVKIEHKKK